ncbi:MAG: glycosyltransferase, partial [Clostridiaceae bacterium]|nr:glycosyltransferase [Clostridiaceae bacterium]
VMVGLTEKQKKNLPKNIIGITRTNNVKELAEIYSAADVFVNPTLEEVLGLVNLEALACGTPVITFDTGGSVECVDEGCGIVVEKGNVRELIEAINNIRVNNFDKKTVIEKSQKFSNKEKYNEYINLYNIMRNEIIR